MTSTNTFVSPPLRVAHSRIMFRTLTIPTRVITDRGKQLVNADLGGNQNLF